MRGLPSLRRKLVKRKQATPICAATADSHYAPEGNRGSINHQVDGKTTASTSTNITRFFARSANQAIKLVYLTDSFRLQSVWEGRGSRKRWFVSPGIPQSISPNTYCVFALQPLLPGLPVVADGKPFGIRTYRYVRKPP